MQLTDVIFTFYTPQGVPVGETDFTVQLMRPGYDQQVGVIQGETLYLQTDASGTATVSLAPSNTPYFVKVDGPDFCSQISYRFFVVESVVPVHFQDLVDNGQLKPADLTQETIRLIIEAKVQSVSSAASAKESETNAKASETAASGSAFTATNKATEAAASASKAKDSEDHAKASEERTTTLKDSVEATAVVVQQTRNDMESLYNQAVAIGFGWAPVMRVVADGSRYVLQVTDWTGGRGTKPATGYMGATGIVAAIGSASDIRGAKGIDGTSFTVNATGTLAQRNAHDSKPAGFTYLATDNGLLYIRETATAGVWSPGIPFGKGDKGDTGDRGPQGMKGDKGDTGLGFTQAQYDKLDGIEAGAQKNVATNLSTAISATAIDINSSTGTKATIPGATTTAAGLLTAADMVKLNGAAPLASPTFTGTVNAPTPSNSSDSTIVATTAFVQTVVSNAINSLDRANIKEPIATAAVTGSTRYSGRTLGAYFDGIYGGGTLGYPVNYGSRMLIVPRIVGSAQPQQEMVFEWNGDDGVGQDRVFYRSISDIPANTWKPYKEFAFTASPAFTGTPTAPTAATTTNTTQLATTAFVQAVNTADTGSSATSVALKTARNFSITGGATAAVKSFNGTADVVLDVTALDMSKVTAGTLAVARGGTGVTTSTGTGSVVLSANAALTDNPTATTQAVEDNSTRLATTAHVKLLVNQTFTAVPATNQGPVVYVTTPHFRTFIWGGTKYVRAPWHMPGVLFFSHAPAASVNHGIQVRADVTYNKADYPDLAEILGVAGSTFILPEGRARVLRAADNGRGIDAALVNGYIQEDAIRNITGTGGVVIAAGSSGASTYGAAAPWLLATGGSLATAYAAFDASRVVPTATENRVKSLSATLYITK